ncbi:hypothetical protein A2311_05765 [candidate division WOR-1 bacterium RIFOXYB2_FULL_48_7]|uniref:DNA mismatch repair protein MutL n=1 Tax=candidate division WOR-1 bacterium RIFOXYB2_FULL_48_7 TaxID=1802583 RepID=A0A1F4TU60_UNCSA|nr:MAG: hypothetical protein A2311_05765 [candidate division WOR-1 bacterium RIFOXYB2_FULL_48_7]
MATAKIKILSDDLINKIAAGEVVERPASIVKELVENSIDAGATQIIIEVEEAGKKLVRVTDNGCGLTEDEIDLALRRHSTSKIEQYSDLFNIHSLGFRGEALPSIASVTKFKIVPNASGRGLTITAKELFYNTPARKKFLKANSTELSHIGDIVAKYALAYPRIAIKLISEGKTLLASTGNRQLLDAILAIYGGEVARSLLQVNHAFPAGQIFGYVSKPTVSRLDKNYENFFVNGRYVKHFLLNRALEEAYRTLIPNNRYPIAVLFIEIDPKLVDVNVHPAKREVKFSNNQVVMEAVRQAVKAVLVDKEKIIGDSIGQGLEPGMADQIPFDLTYAGLPTLTQPLPQLEVSAIQPLIPVYQLQNTYIVATDGVDLILIDQHAAHERIIFDQLCAKCEAPVSGWQQQLLSPETLEVEPSAAIALKNNLASLNELGFEIEEFGTNTFLIRAVPALSSKTVIKPLILKIINDLKELRNSAQIEVNKETIRKLVACHSAIKAGDKLGQVEMGQLIRDLYLTTNPLTCPHGRPTMFRLPKSEIERKFGR